MAKCIVCYKKIPVIMEIVHICRCKGCSCLYCKSHLHDHNCAFDYKEESKSNMINEMQIIVPDK